ncbi:MAG: metal-dependent hydrolase [bacterium]
MVISHLPAGYIAARMAEKKYWKDFSKKQVLWLYAILLFFSVCPDFDLVYFWFINGMNSHREFFTHSLFFYAMLGLGAFSIVKIIIYATEQKCDNEQKKRSEDKFIRWISYSIIIGAITHLALDSILSSVGWAWPFYANPIGLPIFDIYFIWIKDYYFPLFVSIELAAVTFAFYALVCAKAKIKLRENFFYALPVIFFLAAVFLSFSAKNFFYMPPDIGNRDFDGDSIRNEADFDADNDGIENFYDMDANRNGVNNKDEFISEAKKMVGVFTWEGNKFLGLILKLGLISDAAILRVSLEKAGIFLREEMNNDFILNPIQYNDTAYNYNFSNNPENVYIFLKNKKSLICEGMEEIKVCLFQKGDIIFYGDNFNHLAIVVDKNKNDYSVIEAGRHYKKTIILKKAEMEKLYGFPRAAARLP